MITPDQYALLERSLELLIVMLIGGTISAFVFRNFFNWFVILGSFAVAIYMAIFTLPTLGASSPFVIYATLFVFGAAVAADLGGFFAFLGALKNLDPEEISRKVLLLVGITFGVTLMAAIIGLYSGIDFTVLAKPLFYGLFILIGLSIGGIVGFVSRRAEWFIGIFASAFWFVYMIFDFNRAIVQYQQDSWPAAIDIAVNIYLAMINFIVRLAPYIIDN